MPNGQEVLQFSPTTSLSMSIAYGIQLEHGEEVHVTITCVNKLNLRGSYVASPVRILSTPPVSDNTSVVVLPKQYAYNIPKESTQVQGTIVEFSYSGFKDYQNINHFQYLIQTSHSTTEWATIGKLVNKERQAFYTSLLNIMYECHRGISHNSIYVNQYVVHYGV